MVIRRILIDERSSGDPLARRIQGLVHDALITVTPPLDPPYDTVEAPAGTLILTHHPGSFVKDFPVTHGAPPCGEKYITTMLNCPFTCSYCYLQSYLEHGHMMIFTNMDRMKEEIGRAIELERPSRMTTGEFGDSLALDRLTGTIEDLLPLFEGTGTVLEARTKSADIGHLLDAARGGGPLTEDLVLTWTLGGRRAIDGEEHGAAGLDERIAALAGAAAAGIRTAVRLDPVIPWYYDPAEYRELIVLLHRSGARPERFELGVLRFPPGLWEHVRATRPGSRLLAGEYFVDGEGKMRLYRPARIEIYRETASAVREHFPEAEIELSMEDVEVWEDAGVIVPTTASRRSRGSSRRDGTRRREA